MDSIEIEYMKIIPVAGGADMQTTAHFETMRNMLAEYRRLKKDNMILNRIALAAKDIIDCGDLHWKWSIEYRAVREEKLKSALACLPNSLVMRPSMLTGLDGQPYNQENKK
jgi:hypothetical protein